jgi:GxxExxY protein
MDTDNLPSEKYLYQELTREIVGAAMQVHNELGPGFLEKVYELALSVELSERRIPFRAQAPMDVRYKGRLVGHYVADLLVDGKVLCEIKATEALLPAHEAQLLNYLKTTGVRVGLLLNFGRNRLQTKRFIV